MSLIRVTRSFHTKPSSSYFTGQYSRPKLLAALRSNYATDASTSPQAEPFRKLLKNEAKSARLQKAARAAPADAITAGAVPLNSNTIGNWELTVGIEIHAQLNTTHKLFSHARSATEEEPNALTAVFDLAFPGSQPKFQPEVLVPALRAAAALECEVQSTSKFDRKHYFYHDQPAGYQITQYYEPFARNGQLTLYHHDGLPPEDGKTITVGIKQIQLEQDTAKTIQQPPDEVLLDFNRVGHPLIEIISLPHIHHPKTAAAYVRKISQVLLSVNAVTTGLELGGLRADVNVSVRPKNSAPGAHSYAGVSGLGQRTEIKNLSSFKAVEDAIIAERNRQIAILEDGGEIEGETRGWTLGSTETVRLRGKEGEVDYRYMPDPDIPPLVISNLLTEHIRGTLPSLPDKQVKDLQTRCGVSQLDAKALIVDGSKVQYYQSVLDALIKKTDLNDDIAGKMAANWVLHELGGLFSVAQENFNPLRIEPQELASILEHLQTKTISGKTAKKLLAMVFAGDDRPVTRIIADQNLAIQSLSSDEYRTMASSLVNEHAGLAEKVRQGQKGKVQFFVGQMMRQSRGRMNAEEARRAVELVLEIPSDVNNG